MREHIAPGTRCLGWKGRGAVRLADRHRLAREKRFVETEALGFDDPAIGGDAVALADADDVADLVLVLRVVRMELARPADDLLVDRVREAALDQDHDGLVGLVAHHHTLHDAPWHRLTPTPSPASAPGAARS